LLGSITESATQRGAIRLGAALFFCALGILQLHDQLASPANKTAARLHFASANRAHRSRHQRSIKTV
jgi:hypothetical protein